MNDQRTVKRVYENTESLEVAFIQSNLSGTDGLGKLKTPFSFKNFSARRLDHSIAQEIIRNAKSNFVAKEGEFSLDNDFTYCTSKYNFCVNQLSYRVSRKSLTHFKN